jgi:hypothetical protein
MVLTPCAALEMLTGSEVDQIEFVDYSDTGYGGIVYVDNIVGANNGSDIFNIDFESYALGPLPSPWTSYFQSGSSTINVVAF